MNSTPTLIRWLFFMLLAANLTLFAWLRQHPVKTAPVFSATDPSVPGLQLLSEADPAPHDAIWKKDHEENATEIAPVCFRIGPFPSQAAINPVLEPVQSFVIKTRTRRKTASQEAGYWVFLPATKTRAEALKSARKLAQAGVRDYYVVTAGARENTVSLGLYRQKDNAMARLEELQQRGFDAQWEARLEQWPEYWLDVAMASDQADKLAPILDAAAIEIQSFPAACDW